MEIASTGLGLINMDDYRLSATAGVNNPQHNFDEILRRTRESQNTVPVSNETPIDKTDQLYQLCLELETFIIKNLLNGMRNTIPKTGLIDNSFAGKMYEDMLWDEYAKDFTKNAGFGLAEQAYRQLSGL